jgi:hypothetical protein
MAWVKRNSAAPIYRTTAHRRARAALIAAFTPGDACCLCGQPMYPPTRQLHADHEPGTLAYRGLAHAQCNVEDAARRARARQLEPQVTIREW